MQSSDRPRSGRPRRPRAAEAFALALLVASAIPTRAAAQQADGFALERFQPSAAGGGWLVMDALDMRGELGGAMAMSVSYARNPLRVRSVDRAQPSLDQGGSRPALNVVSKQAFADFGFAATYHQLRLYLDFAMPLLAKGTSGTVSGHSFGAPGVDPAGNPDALSDARLGFDARLVGSAASAFRLGAGGQLFVPNGNRADYDTDHTYRAVGRLLFAGDVGVLTYAGHLGVHLRRLDEPEVPGSPRGSELIFGVAAGSKLPIGLRTALVVGPEIYGASALRSLFGEETTALEGLLGGRVEGTGDDGAQVRVKLGVGAGFHPHFGAPEGRVVFALEVFDHRSK